MGTTDQGHTMVTNVCDTLSYGDILMCQIWLDYADSKKSWD